MNAETKPKNRRLALRLNLILLWITRHWLRVVLSVVAVYISLPFIAPTLMHFGVSGPARVIYTLYSPFCHQFAFRSFFLFGEQSVYPRANTGTGVTPFEAIARDLPEFEGIDFGNPDDFSVDFILAARSFVGNDEVGFKLTLCERDISIYIAIFIGGLGYTRVRRRLRPSPLWLYVFFGLGPIGLDGFSQLLGYEPFNLWPARETLPIFRVVTGAIFGFMSVWLAFPYIEESMRDTRRAIEGKLIRAGVLLAKQNPRQQQQEVR